MMDIAATNPRIAQVEGGLALVGLAILLSPLHLVGAVVFVAGVAALSWTRPTWGLWLVLVLFLVHPLAARIATYNFGVTDKPLLIASAWKEVAIAVVIASFGFDRLRAYRSGWRPAGRLSILDVAAAGLVALVIFGLALRHDGLALNEARLLLFPFAVYLALRMRPIDVATLFKALIAVGVGIAAFAVIQSSFFGWQWVTTYWGSAGYLRPYTFWALHLNGPRGSGTLAAPNDMGFALMLIALMATGLIAVRPDRSRWFVPALAAVLLGVGMTFSRSAVAFTAVGVLLVVVLAFRYLTNRRRAALLLVGALVPALLVGGVVYESRGGVALIQSTLVSLPGFSSGSGTGTTDSDIDPSTVAHFSSIGSGWKLMASHPAGMGLGTVGPRAVPGSDERPSMVFESWYLTMGVMLGWAGLAWCLLFLFGLLLEAAMAIRRGAVLVGAVLAGVAVCVGGVSFLLPTMMEPEIAMLAWAVGALAVAVPRPSPAPEAQASASS